MDFSVSEARNYDQSFARIMLSPPVTLTDIVVLLLFIGVGVSHFITEPTVEKTVDFSAEAKANLVLLYAQVSTIQSSLYSACFYREVL